MRPGFILTVSLHATPANRNRCGFSCKMRLGLHLDCKFECHSCPPRRDRCAFSCKLCGGDGYQNVLWSVNYSQVVREQVKCKKPDVFRRRNKNKPQNQQKQHNTQKRKTSSKLSETQLRFQNNEILGALSSSSRRHRDSRE